MKILGYTDIDGTFVHYGVSEEVREISWIDGINALASVEDDLILGVSDKCPDSGQFQWLHPDYLTKVGKPRRVLRVALTEYDEQTGRTTVSPFSHVPRLAIYGGGA